MHDIYEMNRREEDKETLLERALHYALAYTIVGGLSFFFIKYTLWYIGG